MKKKAPKGFRWFIAPNWERMLTTDLRTKEGRAIVVLAKKVMNSKIDL